MIGKAVYGNGRISYSINVRRFLQDKAAQFAASDLGRLPLQALTHETVKAKRVSTKPGAGHLDPEVRCHLLRVSAISSSMGACAGEVPAFGKFTTPLRFG